MKKQPLDLKPASDGLQIVVDFVNTADRRQGIERLSSPRALADWLAGRRLLDPGVELSAADLERALDVREGLRALLRANNGAALDTKAVRRLDRAATPSLLRVRFAEDGEMSVEPAADAGLDRALGHLIGLVYTARRDGLWPRLKACRDGTCRKAFYDHSKNRSGKWCSMRRCGSRLHSRAYRRRYKAANGKWPRGGFRPAYK